jgi:hypothetical protein
MGMENRVVEARSKSTYTPEYKRLRTMLATARKEAGLTQADLAALLKRPQSFVSKIDSGNVGSMSLSYFNCCVRCGSILRSFQLPYFDTRACDRVT